MNSNNGNDKDNKSGGFSNFSSMLSDIDDIEIIETKEDKSTDNSAEKNEDRTNNPTRPKNKKTPVDVKNTTKSGISFISVFWVAVAFVIGASLIANMSGSTKTSSNSSSSSSSSYSLPSSSSNDDSSTTTHAKPTRPTESKPSYGTGKKLSWSEIRYCRAEDERISAAKGYMDNYVQNQVDRFNSMVSDYNSRCSNFRYRSGGLSQADKYVAAYRNQIRIEGIKKINKNYGMPKANSNNFSSSKTVSSTKSKKPKATPDETVRGIQARLNILGYKAGPADGFYGNKTRKAIKSFQSKEGLVIDGQATRSLLLNLNNVKIQAVTTSIKPKRAPNLSNLSRSEKSSIESACSNDKYLNGPAAYNNCLNLQLSSLSKVKRAPNLSNLSRSEKSSIESACSNDKYLNGPAAYNNCLNLQLSSLSKVKRAPNLSNLSRSEKSSIESACSNDKYLNGPAAYNNCLNLQLSSLSKVKRAPNLSNLSRSEKSSIESACSNDKYLNGPAAYNNCLNREINKLH